MEEIVAVARPDDVDSVLGDAEDSAEIAGVAPVKNDKGVVAGAAGADLVGETGDELHLPQTGGVALGHHRCAGSEILERATT